MIRPDAARVRALLPNVPWATNGYPAPASGDPDPLQPIVDVANAYVEETTGRTLDATMPENLAPIAEMAAALATAAFVSDFSADQLDALAAGSVLASFTTPDYSETYRDGGALAEQQRKGLMIHPWAPLNRMLWILLTPAQRAYWFGFLQGGGIPSYGVAEIDWSGANRWGGLPGAPGDGGMAGDELGRRAGGDAVYPTGSFPGVLGTDGALD